MPVPIVQVTDLTYYYPDEPEPALDGVNLEIQPGEFVLLVGPSGCGKSTLALALNGIIPTLLGGRIKGQVQVNGLDTRAAGVYALSTQVGLVFQDPDSQLCNLTVEDEVGFGPANLLLPADEVLRRIESALAAVGGAALRPKSIFELSGGQKQRVAIASVLAMQPKVVIFDEPTANLDPLGAVQVFELLKRLNQAHGLTVIVIEHNVEAVMHHAGRLILMEQGAIRADAPPRAMLRERGVFVTDQLGLRIPPVSELALRLAEQGRPLEPFPLTLPEALAGLQAQHLRLISPPPLAPVAPAAAPPIIHTERLNFVYPDGTHAVKDVTLAIARGDVVGLIGENGSGKTTLTSLFVGLHKPTSGRGVVSGLDLAATTTRALVSRVGYVFQYPEHQFVAETVYAEVAFSLKAQRLPAADVAARVERILHLFDLDRFRDRHPFRLSMGQKRRLSVATMLVLQPEILILDEPTMGQDRRNIEQMLGLVQQANTEGTTVILVTHDMELVARYCRTIAVMDRGELVFSGSRADFGRDFAGIRSPALVLPALYELAQRLHAGGSGPAPQVFTVADFVAAVGVAA